MANLRICFVTCQLEGFDKNGGIGTATRYIAEGLAHAGHDVSLCYTRDESTAAPAVCRELASQGIAVHFVNGLADLCNSVDRRPYRVYEVLKDTDYDVYVFPDWLGEGFYCFLAKESGVAFTGAQLGVILHSPTKWCYLANRRLIADENELAISEMERACIERADFVLSPSQYMIDWARQEGWRLPDCARMIPNLVTSPGAAESVPTRPALSQATEPLREVAFFGRLEERKGIRVFIESLKLLPRELLQTLRVTFLGSECDLRSHEIRQQLGPDVVRALAGLKVITQYGSLEARQYLVENRCLAVMPSLVDNSPCVVWECLERGIPFVISDRGGGMELVAEADRPRTCFAPDPRSLAAKLAERLRDTRPLAPPQPAFSRRQVIDLWNDFLGWAAQKQTKQRVAAATEVETQPPVSIVVVHHNRPKLLRHALASLVAQDYANKEIILVDDGSDHPEAVDYLRRVEDGTAFNHPIRVVRQANRYLGAARNAGVAAAGGPYVVFFDDDNIALPHMVSTLVRAIKRSGADCVSAGERFFHDPEGQPIAEDEANQRMMYWGGATRLTGMITNHFGDAVGIYRTELVKRLGGFHEVRGVTHEDWKLYADIQLAGGRIATVPEVLFWYRVTPGSMFRTTHRYDNVVQSLLPYKQQLPEVLSDLPEFLLGLRQAGRPALRAAQLVASIPVIGPLARRAVRLKRRLVG